MTKSIRAVEPTVKRIRVKEPPVKRIAPDLLAEALGAEPFPARIEARPGPFTLYAIRQEIVRRRQSSGGRPGIEGTSFRAKIPLGEPDWRQLEILAAELSGEGFTPSPGQVGSILLSLALRSVTKAGQDSNGTRTTLARELISRMAGEHS